MLFICILYPDSTYIALIMAEPHRGANQPDPYLGVYDASSSSSDDEKQERGRKRHPHTRRYYESIRLQRIKGGKRHLVVRVIMFSTR